MTKIPKKLKTIQEKLIKTGKFNKN